MKNFSIKKIFICLLFILFLSAQKNIVFAQNSNSCSTGIFPNIVICGRSPQNTVCPVDPISGKDTTKPCTMPDFIEVLSRVLLFGITFVLLLLPLAFVWVGVQMIYQQGNPYKLSSLKEKATNIIIGLIVVFAAWLIVKTIVTAFGVRISDNPENGVPNFLLDNSGNKTDLNPR
jgi:hypothetical protein